MTNNDFSALEQMTYSGRGITVGMTPSGAPFIGYSLTGRSPPSQARELVYDEKNQVVRTSVTDPEQLADGSPALLLYPAIANSSKGMVVSNGAQTKLIYSEAIRIVGKTTEEVLGRALGARAFGPYESFWEYDAKEGWIDITSYEPDAPNFTPRISAYQRGSNAAMYIVRKTEDGGLFSIGFKISLIPKEGKLITTYKGGNEKPLLPFDSNPLDVAITSESPEEIVDSLYDAIKGGQNPEDNYRVASAVMMLKDGKPEVAIRNRNELGS